VEDTYKEKEGGRIGGGRRHNAATSGGTSRRSHHCCWNRGEVESPLQGSSKRLEGHRAHHQPRPHHDATIGKDFKQKLIRPGVHIRHPVAQDGPGQAWWWCTGSFCGGIAQAASGACSMACTARNASRPCDPYFRGQKSAFIKLFMPSSW